MRQTRQLRPARTTSLRLAAGEVVSPHLHDEHQIVYASSGVLSVTTEAGSWIAPADRAIWVPAGTEHQHRAYGPTLLHAIGLAVRYNPLGLSAPAVLAVRPLLRELIATYTGDPPTGHAERTRMLAVLLDRLRHSPQQPIHIPVPSDSRLTAVCAILFDNPADPRSLAQLAAGCGASERTLSRLFRAELGMTFPQWRTQLRLHLALRLLADGTPVTTVAYRCGWASASTFIEVFRRTLGHTPGSYLDARRADQWPEAFAEASPAGAESSAR